MKEFDSESFTEPLSDYENTEFIDCTFHSLDLQDRLFKYSRFIDCKFINCNLSNASFSGASLRDCEFSGSKLIGINFNSCKALSNPIFKKSILNLCTFQELNLPKLIATECSFIDADFSSSQLVEANFCSSDLKGCHFSGSNLEKADFQKSLNYFIDPHLTKIKGAKFSTPEVYSIFKALNIKVDED